VKNLHNILFRNAKKRESIQHLLKFSGIVYQIDKEKERAQYFAKAEKMDLTELRDIAELLGLSLSSAQKNQLVEELIDFLEMPKFEEKKKRTPKRSPKKSPTKGNTECKEENEGNEKMEEGEEEKAEAEAVAKVKAKVKAKAKATAEPPSKKRKRSTTKEESSVKEASETLLESSKNLENGQTESPKQATQDPAQEEPVST